MRRIILSGIFFTLTATLYFLWQYRFERSTEFPTYRLEELRPQAGRVSGVEWSGGEKDAAITLRVDQSKLPVVTRLEFPGLNAVSSLHLRYRITSGQLEPGREKWADGRGMIEWHSDKSRSTWENDGFTSVRDDSDSGIVECVLRPEAPPAVPALRLENLGTAGELTLSMFEATVLREREIWRIGRWILMAAWIAWVAACIGPVGRHWFVRPALTGAVSLLMVIFFVVPGPWKILHPLGGKFQIGPEIRNIQLPPTSPEIGNQPAPKLESVGKIPDKGDITLRIKHLANLARPLLHSLLLFAPALVISCLIGWKRMIPLMALLSVAIETAQVMFGYGFDWADVFDLFNDAIGIALAVLLYRRLRKLKSPRLASLLEF